MEAKKTFGWKRKLLVLMALVPLGLAVAANWVNATPSPIHSQQTSPALIFQQYLVNLGPIPSSKKYVSTRFIFKNGGKHPVTITELKPSCGCLQPRLSKKVLQPSERGDFLLQVSTISEAPGKHDYFVTIKYTDPQPHEAVVHFKFILSKKQIDIQPQALIFYQLNGEPATQQFVVTDYRAQPMNVKKVSSTSKFVNASLQSTDVDELGNRRTHVSVTVAGKVPPGKTRVHVIVETDDPQFDKMIIPLWVEGPVVKQIKKVKQK